MVDTLQLLQCIQSIATNTDIESIAVLRICSGHQSIGGCTKMSSEDNNDDNRLPIDPVPSLNGDRGRNLVISNRLKELHITVFQKHGLDMWMLRVINEDRRVIIFKIKKEGLSETLNEFQKAANKQELDIISQQAIVYELSSNKDYVDILQYRVEDDADLREGIGIPTDHMNDFFIDDNAVAREIAREQDPNAAEIAEQEYNDEGLPLLTVEQVLKLDKPQRVRIIGQVQKAKHMFDLIKQIVVNCDNKKCGNKNKHERFNLRSGLYTMGDLPYVFPGGPTAAEQFLKCKSCGKFMIATPTQNRFQNARMVELEHVDIKGDGTTAALNSAETGMRHIDTLPVRVSGIHTQKIRQGEQIEIIGELLIVPSGVNSASRQTMQPGIRRRNQNEEIVYTENMGKYHKLFYADKIKYISRARQINYNPERDTVAIRKFVSLSICPTCKMTLTNGSHHDFIDRLVSMFAVHIKGEELAKEAFLLQAVGPAPILLENWYDRFNMNIGLFGDVGTAKSLFGMESMKLLPGSRDVTAIHSTARSIIAVAEKDTDGPWYPHLGPAILADRANLFIDELSAMQHWDDQDHFLRLMITPNVPFNKGGIDETLHALVNFTLAANPSSLNWREPNKITKDDLPAKLTVLDRLDIIIIFKDIVNKDVGIGAQAYAQYKQNVKNWAYDMVDILERRYNLDYQFLRKYIYYVKTLDQLKTFKIESKELKYGLVEIWAEIKSKYPTLIGNRGIGVVYRIASCYARLMLKPTVDQEVVERTRWFISEMYKRFGNHIANPETQKSELVNERDRVVEKMCLMTKNIAQGKDYFLSEDDTEDVSEVSFKDLLQTLADRDDEVLGYLRMRNRKRIGHNRRAEDLHKLFLEKCGSTGYVFEGGKIVVTNDTAPRGLILKWIEDGTETEDKDAAGKMVK